MCIRDRFQSPSVYWRLGRENALRAYEVLIELAEEASGDCLLGKEQEFRGNPGIGMVQFLKWGRGSNPRFTQDKEFRERNGKRFATG